MSTIFVSGQITLEDQFSFENFVSQFQKYTEQILCIENGTLLRIYERVSDFPANVILDYKRKKTNLTEYYFRVPETNNRYCVFGRDKALNIFPRLDFVDKKSASEETVPVIKDRMIITPEFITIIDKGIKISFPNPNYEIEIESYKSL